MSEKERSIVVSLGELSEMDFSVLADARVGALDDEGTFDARQHAMSKCPVGVAHAPKTEENPRSIIRNMVNGEERKKGKIN